MENINITREEYRKKASDVLSKNITKFDEVGEKSAIATLLVSVTNVSFMKALEESLFGEEEEK